MSKLSEDQIKEKRLEVLEDVAKYFNSKTRNATVDNTCQYLPVTEGSEGCAVGRLIKDKELCARLDEVYSYSSGVVHDKIFEQLPEEVKVLGQAFLTSLQDLHDQSSNWNENGLSARGITNFNEIKNKFVYIN